MAFTELETKLIKALREIYGGSYLEGRWLAIEDDGADGEALHGGMDDGKPAGPPAGYYDVDHPETRREGLLPARYEGYTGEEQDQWLAGVADTARRALVAAGVPLFEPEIETG